MTISIKVQGTKTNPDFVGVETYETAEEALRGLSETMRDFAGSGALVTVQSRGETGRYDFVYAESA